MERTDAIIQPTEPLRDYTNVRALLLAQAYDLRRCKTKDQLEEVIAHYMMLHRRMVAIKYVGTWIRRWKGRNRKKRKISNPCVRPKACGKNRIHGVWTLNNHKFINADYSSDYEDTACEELSDDESDEEALSDGEVERLQGDALCGMNDLTEAVDLLSPVVPSSIVKQMWDKRASDLREVVDILRASQV